MFRSILISLLLCTALSGQQDWWDEAVPAQREIILWYTQHYGPAIGSKCILESSGGADMDHGDEPSYRELGLNIVTARLFRPGMTRQALLDSLRYGSRHWHGHLCREIIDDNLYRMRHKERPALCAAFVYQGWTLWMERKRRIESKEWYQRLARAKLDLRWRELLKRKAR